MASILTAKEQTGINLLELRLANIKDALAEIANTIEDRLDDPDNQQLIQLFGVLADVENAHARLYELST